MTDLPTGGDDSQLWMIHIVQLDEQRRFEIARLVLTPLHLDFSTGLTVHCWGLQGSSGQIQMLPATSALSQARDALDELVALRGITWEQANDRDLQILRRLSGLLRIGTRPRNQSVNVRVTLPSSLVQMKLFTPPEPIVVVALGEVVEIWRQERWRDETRVTNLRSMAEEVRLLRGAAEAHE